MDQVSLVGPNDAASLKYHIECTALFNPEIRRTFYIYAENRHLTELAELLQSDKCLFIAESQLLDPQICRNKWIYQQLLKLSVDQLHKTHNLSELFLFTDVDTLPLRPVKRDLFFRGDTPLYYTHSEHESPTMTRNYTTPENPVAAEASFAEWHYSMTWSSLQLLGIQQADRLGAIDACVIWSQRTLRKLKRHVEKTTSLSWSEAIINKWLQFICTHQQCFFRCEGFRNIEFRRAHQAEKSAIIGIEELQQNLRLGFSEWQLYTYFTVYFEKAERRWLGLLGNNPGPHVCEFHNSMPQSQLQAILDNQGATPFLYFYPGINGSEETLNKYLGLLRNKE